MLIGEAYANPACLGVGTEVQNSPDSRLGGPSQHLFPVGLEIGPEEVSVRIDENQS